MITGMHEPADPHAPRVPPRHRTGRRRARGRTRRWADAGATRRLVRRGARADRRGAGPPRNRDRAGRQQRRQLLLRPRGPGHPGPSARRIQGRDRRDRTPGRALPACTATTAGVASCASSPTPTPTSAGRCRRPTPRRAWYQFRTAHDLPIAQPVARRNRFSAGRRPRRPRDRARPPFHRRARRRTGRRSAAAPSSARRSTSASCCSTSVAAWSCCPARAPGSPPSRPRCAPSPTTTAGPTTPATGRCTHRCAWVDARSMPRRPGSRSRLRTTAPRWRAASSLRTTRRAPRGTSIARRTIGFGSDVLPVLARLVDLQWVNTGFLRSNGWGTDGDFLDPETLEVLARPGRRSAGGASGGVRAVPRAAVRPSEPDAVPADLRRRRGDPR